MQHCEAGIVKLGKSVRSLYGSGRFARVTNSVRAESGLHRLLTYLRV